MITKREIAWLIILMFVFEFIIFFPLKKEFNVLVIFVPPLIILTNLITKKIFSNYFSIKIEQGVWKVQRWGFYTRSYFKKPILAGLIFPFLISLISLGSIRILTFFQFEPKNFYEKRILKQRGAKRKSEMNESDIGLTAAYGFYSLLFLSFIGILIRFPELAKYPIYYNLWNLLPLSNLDGAKVFYGTILNWGILIILNLLFLILVLMIF